MRIGLTYTGTEWKHENYVKWIKADEDIEVIRLDAELANLHEMQEIDGLVLSGGVDIDPELYDGALEYAKAPVDGWQTERDLFEQATLQMAWELGLPVLGVCRGLQLINVSLTGTLIQDLGIIGDAVHESVAGVDAVHGVSLLPGTLLRSTAGKDSGVVNSAHHQAIDRLGEGLTINCLAEDGTVEGIEWADPAGRPFLLAVQWHPERMYVNGFADGFLYRAIRDQFINAIKK
jgi:putative glutamine amidotransferase